MAEAAGDQLKSAEEALDEAERGMSCLLYTSGLGMGGIVYFFMMTTEPSGMEGSIE